MIPIYEETSDHIQILEQPSRHIPPHLHKSIEMIYVTHGSFIVGTGTDLFEMKEGDFAVVFPNLIHHYQVFENGDNRHIALLASPSYFGSCAEMLQTYRPENPVIKKEKLHPDITWALRRLEGISRKDHRVFGKLPSIWDDSQPEAAEPFAGSVKKMPVRTRHRSKDGTEKKDPVKDLTGSALNHAFVQILIARALPAFSLNLRSDIRDQDIVYQVVAYVSAHYQENISLTGMAADLGISPFALSRVFSGVFHQNFNRYVNDVRLEHVSVLLMESSLSITEICLDCGFQSQATFNRVFQAKYHMTPREYRNAKTTVAPGNGK